MFSDYTWSLDWYSDLLHTYNLELQVPVRLHKSLQTTPDFSDCYSLHQSLPGYSLLTGAIPHTLTAQELHSLTTDSRLYHNGSCSLLYSFSMDCTENTASNSSSTGVYISVASHVMFTDPLPSNRSLFKSL
jgi:hypothetical protein